MPENPFLETMYLLATGNQGSGENKDFVVAAALAKRYWDGAHDEDAKPAERLAYLNAMADRAYGKAAQEIRAEVTHRDERGEDVKALYDILLAERNRRAMHPQPIINHVPLVQSQPPSIQISSQQQHVGAPKKRGRRPVKQSGVDSSSAEK